GGWLDAVEVGMVTNFVALECRDHILAPAPLQGASLFADNFERCPNPFVTQEIGDTQGGIIAGRQDVVLGIEPENDIDPRCRLAGGNGAGDRTQTENNQPAKPISRNGSRRHVRISWSACESGVMSFPAP